MAQEPLRAQQQPAQDGPLTGTQERGVRIIAAEPPPAPVAPAQQPTTPPPSHAIRPQPVDNPAARLPLPAPVIKTCDRPVTRPTLRMTDPTRLDRSLRGRLRGSRTVVVDLETPYPANDEAPAPLGAWLNEIKQSGGAVTVSSYCNNSRGFGSFFARIFGGGPADAYRAARRYDAVLHVDAVDQVVTQVAFTPRKAPK